MKAKRQPRSRSKAKVTVPLPRPRFSFLPQQWAYHRGRMIAATPADIVDGPDGVGILVPRLPFTFWFAFPILAWLTLTAGVMLGAMS